MMNFTSILKKICDKYPGKDFIIEDNNSATTYGAFLENMNRVCGLYRRLQVKSGDRIMILLPNSASLLLYHFAALEIGAVSVPVKTDYKSREILAVLENCRPGVFVTYSGWKNENRALGEQLSSTGTPRFILADEIDLEKFEAHRHTCLVGNHDIASINYSYSGDGYPKGAVLTHGNHIYAATGYARHQGFVPADIFLITLPIPHVFALSGCINSSLIKGATIVIINSYSPKSLLAAIEKYKITVLSAVPPLYELLAKFKRKEQYDLSSLRLCVTGGDEFSTEMQQKFEKMLNRQIIQGYGLTESLPVICNPHGKKNKPGTLGIPGRKDIKVKIVNDRDEEMPMGEIGEIIIKSPTTMLGYYNLPEDTKRVLKNGWLYTGDFGAVDADGYLHFCGLKKNMFNIYGNNADPGEIESVLLEHPLIAKAGIYLEELANDSLIGSRRICADIYVKKGEEVTKTGVIFHCQQRIAHYKIPKKIEIHAAD